MQLSNRLMYVLLGLAALMTAGMLAGSWRLVLYPLLPIIGISALFGFIRELPSGRRGVLVAGVLVVMFAAFFVVLDAMTGGEPTGSTSYIIGMTPPTALYLIVWPLLVLVAGVLYAATFAREDVDPATLEAEREAVSETGEEGSGR